MLTQDLRVWVVAAIQGVCRNTPLVQDQQVIADPAEEVSWVAAQEDLRRKMRPN